MMTFEEELIKLMKAYGDLGCADIIALKRKHCLDKQKVKELISEKRIKEAIADLKELAEVQRVSCTLNPDHFVNVIEEKLLGVDKGTRIYGLTLAKYSAMLKYFQDKGLDPYSDKFENQLEVLL